MQMNPVKLLQFKTAWDEFQRSHTKFTKFIKTIGQGALSEGSILEIKATTAEGKSMDTNLKVTAQDMELIRQIREMLSENEK